MSRMHPIAALKRLSAASWLRLLLLALCAVQGPGHAWAEPPTAESAAVGWITGSLVTGSR